MPRLDDRAARVLARTQEINLDEEVSRNSPGQRSRRSERIVINNEEMDVDRVVQKVRERLSSPQKTPKPPSPLLRPEIPSPKSLIEDRKSTPRVSIKEDYQERPSPRSPKIESRLPVTEVREIVTRDIIPEPPLHRVSAPLSYDTLKRSTREEVIDSIKGMNSQQLREEILKLRSEKTIRSSLNSKKNISVREDKVPVYDQDTGTWILFPRNRLPEPPIHHSIPRTSEHFEINPPRLNPPLIRRGTTRDAYPTKTYDPEAPNTVEHPELESTDIDFDNMTEVQRREFLDEMKMKFSILKKNYPDFPIPVIHDDDNPKWVFGIYEQLLDMAKGDASQPIYQTGLQVVFLILQVVLSVSGIPAKEFFTFHARHFSQYNKLMVELGEKWGPIIDVTSSTETKLALAIGWNTVVFAVVSVVASKFGDKWGTTAEQILNKITTSTNGASNAKMDDLRRQFEGREEVNVPSDDGPVQSGAGGGDMMGGIANLLGGLLGGGSGGGGGGIANLLGGLLGGATGSAATSTERKAPVYDD